jgi:hypothetical protein
LRTSSPAAPTVDGRFSRKFLDSSELGEPLALRPRTADHRHRHAVQEEVYTVINGSGRIKLDDEIIDQAVTTASTTAATSGLMSGQRRRSSSPPHPTSA